jgi:hypothetical protein
MVKKVCLFSIFLILLISCKREPYNTFQGNRICASKDFEFLEPLTVSESSINLNISEYQKITAKFNETVKWQLEIIGLNSGAKKIFKPVISNYVDIKWFGNPSYPKFFMKEPCRIVLKINCDKLYTLDFELIEKPTFRKPSSFYVLLTDFDDGATFNFSTGIGLTVDTSTTYSTLGPSPQGGKFCRYFQSRNDSVWFFGQVTINRSTNLINDLKVKLTPNDTKNIYLNLFYAGSDLPNNELYIRLGELRALRLQLDKKVWQYAYIKLGDLFIDDYSYLISNPEFMLQSFPQKVNKGEMNFDFVIFTYKEPFLDFNVLE